MADRLRRCFDNEQVCFLWTGCEVDLLSAPDTGAVSPPEGGPIASDFSLQNECIDPVQLR
jgi:hypothetical protein